MKKSPDFLVKCFVSILFTLILIEIGLRLFPGLIPLHLLTRFEAQPRAEIARSRELPTEKWDTVVVERDDGGPELRIYKPFTKITWPMGSGGTVVMDEMGFCNLPENSYRQETIDIVALGDSFTTCHAVKPRDTWSSRLAQLTGDSVYNLGRVKIGLHEYIQLLKKFGLQKSPKIVIINVYEGNDFRDARRYYREIKKNDSALPDAPTPTGHYFFDANLLKQYSYAANLFLSVISYLEDTYFYTPEPNEIEINFKYHFVFPGEVEVPFNSENVDTDEVENALRMTTLQTEPEVFEVIEQALATFVELSEQDNFIPLVTYTPSAHTAYSDYVVFDDPKLKNLMASFSQVQRQYLSAKGEELGYYFVDFTPSLQAAGKAHGPQDLLYYQLDLHLTPSGHAVVAGIIDQALQDLELLEE